MRRLARSDQGAIAPLTAMTLFGLIAVGGIAFDYARLASMDTELQQAADQAALAAATQLDGQTGACARAAGAAAGLLANQTLFSNDGSGTSVAVPTSGVTDCTGNAAIQFYQSYDRVTDSPGPAATADDNARIVIVSITPREAFYSLTPIVAAFRSGNINAQAVAALGSSICKTPPVMICNPTESGSNTSFDPSAYVGDGLRLTAVGNGTGTWVPGNFGYLQTGGGSSGAPGIREALGWNTPPGNCLPDNGVDTKPGATTTVTDALNTRFDIYDSGQSCPSGGSCSASINSLKDLRRPANANNNNGCASGPQGWQLDSSGAGYYGENVPTTAAPLPATTILSAMGHPRDMCHAVSNSGTCTGDRIGDGNWDADAYFRTNYVRSVDSAGGAAGTRWTAAQWQANTGLSPTAPRVIPGTTMPNPAFASRYNVYQWEIAQRDNLVDGVIVLGPRSVGATGNDLVSYGKPQCSAPNGFGSGVVPGPTVPDRRRISVAVVNCIAEDVRGNSTGVQVEKWIDVFLVEPSVNRSRTNNGDLYAEIIGEAVSGGAGSTVAQVVRHDLPYLIK
ncbi:MAG TPA: pilus assembly protein TadG-related protein [Sphingomicrobium sp.]|nr:pilus assembly protein TadG-related protein [Sphingomicrobium sp.]